MTNLPNLSYYRSILLKLAQLPDDELWQGAGLQDELEPFWEAVRASWAEHLPELLEPRSEPDLSAFEDAKPFDADAFLDDLIERNAEALAGLAKLDDE